MKQPDAKHDVGSTSELGKRYLIFGLGVTGLAVARALHTRNASLILADDRPSDRAIEVAAELATPLLTKPSSQELAALMPELDAVHPTPGLPESHPVFAQAAACTVPTISEFDLAQRWDDRPIIAITGTNGKTTVCSLATAMLHASGVPADLCGNSEVPLVEAIANSAPEVFVVEASSFRLAQSKEFSPKVAAWLNYGPDHLDVHDDLASYELSKAKIWARVTKGATLVANADDHVVLGYLPSDPLNGVDVVTFAASHDTEADYRVLDGVLCGPVGELVAVGDLWRQFPHDIENVLAAAAVVFPLGATIKGVAEVARSFTGLAHRVEAVAVIDGVSYVNDSKATVPHATISAIAGFAAQLAASTNSDDPGETGRIVLIAGGRNKGLDLSPLASQIGSLRGVVAIGEAAAEVQIVFEGQLEVEMAGTMAEAIELSGRLALPGDIVLLSPACASFDQYRSYADRGEHFSELVRSLVVDQHWPEVS
ncbi:MAG: UDP-N-acetylmuramoyl-L-alanine--D-glutamate ligase [Acidimicrobiales bacterium]